MKVIRRLSVLWMAAALLGLAAHPAAANRIAGDVVTGQVTSIRAPYEIVIDGHAYAVKASSAAAGVLHTLSPGDRVDLVLDGPKGNAATQVTAVLRHSGN